MKNGKITYEDGTWTNVQCNQCVLAHKLLTKHMTDQYKCPYCLSDIDLSKDEAPIKAAAGGMDGRMHPGG